MTAFLLISCGQTDNQSNEDSLAIATDPLTNEQWYLNSRVLSSTTPTSSHINLNQTRYKGEGVLISLVDDGVDIGHPDLVHNIANGNYSYLDENHNFSASNHGTAVAGIMVAQENNGIGIRGIAPKAKVVAYNALKTASFSHLADALLRNAQNVWVSNNSWGDFNSWGAPFALRSIIKSALAEGVSIGRNGRGIIYVFAAGNGAESIDGTSSVPVDNTNYSGLVNNRYVIPVCAVNEFGQRAGYSEKGATLVVCAPSKGQTGRGVVTTDATNNAGYNPETFDDDLEDKYYTKQFGGTSASAPMVSASVALLLEANPTLGWRDIPIILAKSATKVDIENADWIDNTAGLSVNHNYGFGLINVDNALNIAENWNNVGTQMIAESSTFVNQTIVDGASYLNSSLYIAENFTIEFVEITFDAPSHNSIGDLEIKLTAPSGTSSLLAEVHSEIFPGLFRYNQWVFGSNRNLLEQSQGVWTLEVSDKIEGNTGQWISWSIKIYGH